MPDAGQPALLPHLCDHEPLRGRAGPLAGGPGHVRDAFADGLFRAGLGRDDDQFRSVGGLGL